MPYQPPQLGQFGAPIPPDGLAPARNAAVMMFIIGGLALACGVFFGAMVWNAQDDVLTHTGMKMPDTTGTPYTPAQVMRFTCIAAAGMVVLSGFAFIGVGWFVRRGSKVAAIVAMIQGAKA